MAMFGHLHRKNSAQNIGDAIPRQPEGVRKRKKEWHELRLLAILGLRVQKAGGRKVKIHDFRARTLLRRSL